MKKPNLSKSMRLLFKEKKPIGNLKKVYLIYLIYKEQELSIGEIRVFKKGEYCLPEGMFPRNDLMPQKTKSIQLAKKKCQNWWNDFTKFI